MSRRAAHVVVRDARAEDTERIDSLTLHAYGEYAKVMSPEAWAALDRAVRAALPKTEGMERIVAERGDSLVGSVRLYPAGENSYGDLGQPLPVPEIRLLAVAPGDRGLGVGRMLVEECVRRARRAGATELGLHTSVSMQSAIRLYRDLGFVRAPSHDFRAEGAELVEAFRLRI